MVDEEWAKKFKEQPLQTSFQFVPFVQVIDPGPRPFPHLTYNQPRPYQWAPLPNVPVLQSQKPEAGEGEGQARGDDWR